MGKADLIKTYVKEFYQRNAFGRSEEDNFVPWWLTQEFKLSKQEAMSCSSDGSFDFGIDGFYVEEKDSEYKLALIQGKFTNDKNQIRKGVTDITRFIPKLIDMLEKHESDSIKENILIKRIRSRVSDIDLSKKQLEIHAIVVSLWDNDKEMLLKYTDNVRNELIKVFERIFVDKNVSMKISVYDVNDILKDVGTVITTPPKSISISFSGRAQMSMGKSTLAYGVCKLKELVDLYTMRGHQLFARNVRYYLYKRKNTKHGPSAKICTTLNAINNGSFSPEKFLFLHNGVTIFSEESPAIEDKRIALLNPYVLNGCQTIKSAYFFFQDMTQKKKLNHEIWEKIPVFARIVVSPDGKLWREIAESSNRQNALSASALRANDEVQIKLEGEFKKLKIYYQRQEESFENYTRRPEVNIEKEYSNSYKEPIYIENLARTIVCISPKISLIYASRPTDIFEYDNIYNRVFSEENLKNLSFLVLVYNIRNLMDLAIKDAIPENTYKYDSFKPSKYKNLITRLVVKALFKRYEIDSLISEYGEEVLTRRGANPKELKEFITTKIRSKSYPILSIVGNYYWDNDKEKWVSESSPELLKHVEKKLHLNFPIEIPESMNVSIIL